ncbi:apoptosis facilitator Bcl-2-like protein 14 isoform X2 [Emydura macquarii macquarii]|uniref:apoptosis facilitator Bcl-2-like protein 14 isoform X2 n=1 Tax=Emydura macquarii macquarii TaxID=1129001 RepID=UPI00352A130A
MQATQEKYIQESCEDYKTQLALTEKKYRPEKHKEVLRSRDFKICSCNFCGRGTMTSDATMEEISLEDEGGDPVEYKVLMAYAQRRLSVSKYKELLERKAKTGTGSSTDRGEREAGKGETHQDLSIQDKGPTAQRKKQRKKRFSWRSLLPFSCTRGEMEEHPQALPTNQDTVNGYGLRTPVPRETGDASASGEEGEAKDYLHVAEKLAELVSARLLPALQGPALQGPANQGQGLALQGLAHQGLVVQGPRPAFQGAAFRALVRTPSLEADGELFKSHQQLEGDKDEEEKIIETIVALLRQSGDKLEEKIKKDKTFYRSVTEMLSYAFFKKLTDQFLQEVPGDSTRETEGKVQCTKAAFVMEVTTRLTAVDNHPMNMVMGFGIKYLKENFTPWVQKHGGWENALGLLEQEEVE